MTWEVMAGGEGAVPPLTRHGCLESLAATSSTTWLGDGGLRVSTVGRGLAGLLVIFAVVCEGAALAATKPPKTKWAQVPTPAEWDAATPRSAAKGTFARAVMRCAVAASGELDDCRVTRETPPGTGAGAALLSLVPKFRREPPGPKDLREINVTGEWSSVDKAPDWLRRPSPTALRAVFPTEAFKKGIGGSAIIDCIATVQGALNECVAIEEFPAGFDFGGAAIALTPQFAMRPATSNGAPVPSIVRIPINFEPGSPRPIAGSKKVAPPNLPWIEAPSYADVVAAYPPKARERKIGGRATVSCAMTRTGRLAECEVITAEPQNYGFGTAAKALAKHFRLEIRSPEDAAATRDLIVHLPVAFDPSMLNQATPVVGKPNWSKMPTADSMRQTFAALKVEETLRVQLRCAIQAGGYVDKCAVASEQPAGKGVGTAALALAPGFRLTTWTVEGLPTVGGSVTIPLRYEPGTPADAPPAS